MARKLGGWGGGGGRGGVAGRMVARPVAALRDAALGVGRGAVPPAFGPSAPREFEPVITAFERMAADVRRSQTALEEARERTARVLANVATGVIAADDALRVTLANPQAAELLGVTIAPGDVLPDATAADWVAVCDAPAAARAGIVAVRGRADGVAGAFARSGRRAAAERPPEAGNLLAGARETVQLDRLGCGVGGAAVRLEADGAGSSVQARRDEVKV